MAAKVRERGERDGAYTQIYAEDCWRMGSEDRKTQRDCDCVCHGRYCVDTKFALKCNCERSSRDASLVSHLDRIGLVWFGREHREKRYYTWSTKKIYFIQPKLNFENIYHYFYILNHM